MFGIPKEILGEVGLLAVVVIFLIAKIFDWLKHKDMIEAEAKKAKAPAAQIVCPISKGFNETEWNQLIKQMGDLHEWHDKEDATGRKIWYTDSHLTEVIGKLADAVNNQTTVLAKMDSHITTSLKLIAKDLETIKNQEPPS